jgi:hypothetical protein
MCLEVTGYFNQLINHLNYLIEGINGYPVAEQHQHAVLFGNYWFGTDVVNVIQNYSAGLSNIYEER